MFYNIGWIDHTTTTQTEVTTTEEATDTAEVGEDKDTAVEEDTGVETHMVAETLTVVEDAQTTHQKIIMVSNGTNKMTSILRKLQIYQ